MHFSCTKIKKYVDREKCLYLIDSKWLYPILLFDVASV